MPKRWTAEEEKSFKKELQELYIKENKSIKEVGEVLGIAPQTVFQRLQRLGIKTQKQKKETFLNKRRDIHIPEKYSIELAEFFGIMLGDGQVTHFQIIISLGDKELGYVLYVTDLIKKIFAITPKVCTRSNDKYRCIYIGSVTLTEWFYKEGLVSNKVACQVDAPPWIFTKKSYMRAFVRGFFDTDGSIYSLRHGNQISLTNRSLPLLTSLQSMLRKLEYNPSRISAFRVYLTRRQDLQRFVREIGSEHPAKKKRLEKICVGTQAVNGGRL